MKLSYDINKILDDETFRFISGHEIKDKMYAVSSYGRVVSLKNGKQLKQTNQSGYRCVGLQRNDCSRLIITVHRLVAEAFIEKTDIDKQLNRNFVNHKDLHRWNNKVSNLEWVTEAENNLHARINNAKFKTEDSKGRVSHWSDGHYSRGSNNGMSRLTESKVHKICQMLVDKYNYKDISKAIGLEGNINDISVISSIHRKKRWKEISDCYDIPPVTRKHKSNEIMPYLNKICKMILSGKSNSEIYDSITEIPKGISYPKHKVYQFINRIRNGKTHQDILHSIM